MTYAPPGYFQGDGSTYQWENCVLAATTDLIDRATVGAKRVSASKLRTLTGDTSGGVTYEQAAAVAAKYGVTLLPRYGLSRTQVHDLALAGQPFGISILCMVTRYTPYRTNTFTGAHTLYVNGLNPDSTYKVEDPGTSAGYLNWPADLLYRAAEARGGGAINVLVGRDTEGVNRKSIAGKAYASASLTSTVRGAVPAGLTWTVLSTTNGGSWPRASGGQATGWHRILFGGGGSTAYVIGATLA